MSPTCATNRWYPLQVAKAFWDLDDVDNEAAVAPATVADTTNQVSTTIAYVWDLFADGTAYRCDREGMDPNNPLYLNPNQPNAQNMKDYAHYSALSASAIMNHNCLQDQDNN